MLRKGYSHPEPAIRSDFSNAAWVGKGEDEPLAFY